MTFFIEYNWNHLKNVKISEIKSMNVYIKKLYQIDNKPIILKDL